MNRRESGPTAGGEDGGRLTLAYVTDGGLFRPTVLSAYSALRQAAGPVRLVFVGVGLGDGAWRALDQLRAAFPACDIESFAMPDDWLKEATSPKSFITPTALGRMFLPRIRAGRVLYLDGDTMVTGDLSVAAAIDLTGRPLGGVRDFAVMRWRAQQAAEKLARQRDILGTDFDLDGYINSGVLLMDCDAIRAEPALQAAMEDMKAAQGYPTVDQDRINVVFRGRIAHLDAAWNCSWGRLALQRRDATGLTVTAPADRPLVLHFHGPHKPWQSLRFSSLKKGGLHVLRYRRLMAACARDVPALQKAE